MTDVGEPPAERPASLFGVLFVFLGLMAVFGLGVAVVGLNLQGADSRELFDELFVPGTELPFGLRYSGGTAVANKQRWIRLERPPEPDGLPPERAGDAVPPDAVPPEVVLPEAVLVGRYAGPVAVARQFETEGLPSGRELAERRDEWLENDGQGGREAWTGLVDRGVVAWGPWEADYVHLREFLADGRFYDLIRVNLSTGAAGEILVGHWPLGVEGASVEPLREVLRVMRLGAGATTDGGD